MKSRNIRTCLIFALCVMASLPFFSNDIHASESGRTYYVSFDQGYSNGYDENKMWYAGPGTIRVRGKHWMPINGYREATMYMQLRRDNWPASIQYETKSLGMMNSYDNNSWSNGKPFDVSWQVGDFNKRYYLHVSTGSKHVNKTGMGTISYNPR
ncbi:hypothetical protein [Erysipelothrix aquatica]|uniref:hypothetical protein n=1 Tax=Erysipelothrix aquatica TaxID=2683714 RepID=UPI00135BF651|nr:hypothetical protein [Erysipelothrix aquatica]